MNGKHDGDGQRREDPREVYGTRIVTFREAHARLGRWDLAFSWARLTVFVAGVVALVLVFKRGVGPSWPVGAGGLFVALVLGHDRVVRRREHLQAAVGLCEAGLERMDDRWAGKGDAGERFKVRAKDHLYAEDLDLYGRGGLFEWLSQARTPIGQATLAAWLEQPADASVVRMRQGAVAELAPLLGWRHDFALAARALAVEVRDEALLAWAVRAPSGLPARLGPQRLALAAAGSATLVALVLYFIGLAPAWLALGLFVLGSTLSYRLKQGVSQILDGLDRRADELGVLSDLMARLERQPFESAALREVARALQTEGVPPSRRIAQLRRLVHLAESRRNQLGALVMGAVQATPQLALAIEAWRRAYGPAVVRWMKSVGEIEALASLANLRFERPELPFPELVEDGGDVAGASGGGRSMPCFEAEALGHPLIPAARRVCNDLSLGGARQLVLVSGSNMSGKSTLLRTVGVNAVLALAGATVLARRLVLTPVMLGATLRINDSLQDGKSRFYAELTRLKQIVDRAGQTPQLLFLLDEILHGTNSHDRRRGAEGLIRGLLARGALGLVTTHDLALAEMVDGLGARAINVHFEDHLEDGKMTFDYRIKDGVVRKSNALALMRAVGLEV